MALDSKNRALLGVSIAAAVAYLAGGAWHPWSGLVLTKGLTFSTLAIVAFRSRQPLLGAALALSSL